MKNNFFIAKYVFIYKECVMTGGATIDNDINNNQHSARLKSMNIR